jgi:thymidylate synthase
MRVYSAQSANDAWKEVAHELLSDTAISCVGSRLGATREFLHTVIELSNPRDRWVVARTPALNPAFALAEVVWLLAGRSDIAFLTHWFPQYPKYVGCDPQQCGAYGERLRRRFGLDQIKRAYLALRNNPTSRQVVLQIWSASDDLPDQFGRPKSSDVPCNLVSTLKVRQNRLEWLQLVRSNDIDRGVPHNFIQFTILQELMAGWLGIEVGSYVHIADSVHWYAEHSRRMGIDDNVVAAENEDRFAQSFEQSMRAFAALARRMDHIIDARQNNRSPALRDDGTLPKAFENVFAVIAADDARRFGENDRAEQIIARCDNPALLQVWRRWLARISLTRLQRGIGLSRAMPATSRLSHAPEDPLRSAPRADRGDLQPFVKYAAAQDR